MSSSALDNTANHCGSSLTMSRGRNKTISGFGMAWTLSVEIAVAALLPILLGHWLDSKTGKGPWFTLAGMVLGGAAAIRSAYRTLKEWSEIRKDNQNSSSGDSGKRGL